jgi:hypothetical protein
VIEPRRSSIGVARVLPFVITLMTPACSTTKRRFVWSWAFVTRSGAEKPPLTRVRARFTFDGVNASVVTGVGTTGCHAESATAVAADGPLEPASGSRLQAIDPGPTASAIRSGTRARERTAGTRRGTGCATA